VHRLAPVVVASPKAVHPPPRTDEPGDLAELPEPPDEPRVEGARWVTPSSGVYLEGPVALVAPLGDETALFRVVNPSRTAWACASIAPSRQLLVAYDGEKVSLWRHGARRPLLSAPLPALANGQFVHGDRCSVDWAPSSERLLIGGQLWQSTTASIETLLADCASCAHFSPTGRYVRYIGGGKLKVLSLADHKLVLEVTSAVGGAFDDQERLLAVGHDVWDIAARRPVLTTDKQVWSFSPDSRFVTLNAALPLDEKHIVELATGRTRAVVKLGMTRWGSNNILWSRDSRFFVACNEREIHLVDLQRGTHETIPALGDSCSESLAGPVATDSFATSLRLLRFSPFGEEARFIKGTAAAGAPMVSPDRKFLVNSFFGISDHVTPKHAVVYRAAPFENVWPILAGTFAWLTATPVLGRIPPVAGYWELLSPVERVRVRVRVLRSNAAGPLCLAAAREDGQVDVLCPAGVDPPEEAHGFDGGPAQGRAPHLLQTLLETARRGYLPAPLVSPL
jgi:hypothetical protein